MGEIKLPNAEFVEGDAEFLREDEWMGVDAARWRVDVSAEWAPPTYSLAYRGTPFAPLGGIHALTGQSGHGKTMTFTLLISALLGAQVGSGLECVLDGGRADRVVYIDTEMELGNTRLVINRIYSIMGWAIGVPHDEFQVFNLRDEVSAINRWRSVLKIIWEYRPTVVFIDGLLDVINDFNDNAECQSTIYKCMATASHYGISIWCLVHENPGGGKMVGHLGSMLMRKVTDVFRSEKKREPSGVSFTVSQAKARGKDVDDIIFQVVDGPLRLGEPSIMDVATVPADNGPKEWNGNRLPEGVDWAAMMRGIITDVRGCSTRELEHGIKQRFNSGTSRARSIINELERLEYIKRDENKRYYIGHGPNECDNLTNGQDEQLPF